MSGPEDDEAGAGRDRRKIDPERMSGTLQDRMVKVVGGVASQSQVQAINRELDRLTRKIDSMVSPKKPEQQSQQEAPKA